MNKCTSIFLFFLLFSFMVISCGDDNPEYTNIDDLEVIDDNEECNPNSFFLICEVATVHEVLAFEDEDFNWIPLLNEEVGATILFENKSGESQSITVTEKDHYIHKKRVGASCETSIEHISYICQQSETAYVEFSSTFFGQNLTQFTLYRQIIELKDGKLGAPKLIFNLGQPRFGSAVHNFSFNVNTEAMYENRSIIFHEKITLNDDEYKDVYAFSIRETYWADPHSFIYINKDKGLFAVNYLGEDWIKK